jgi:hypothetical protein
MLVHLFEICAGKFLNGVFDGMPGINPCICSIFMVWFVILRLQVKS